MAIICAETLGVKVEDIKVHSGDTDHCPPDLGAWGSRQTLMSGNAVKMASEDAKKQLLEFAYAQSGLNIVYDLDIKDRWVHAIARPERGYDFGELVRKALRGKDGQKIMGRGYYTPHRKGMISPAYSYMLQGVEVEVDEETGKITPHRQPDRPRLRPAHQPPRPHRPARRRLLHGGRLRLPRIHAV